MRKIIPTIITIYLLAVIISFNACKPLSETEKRKKDSLEQISKLGSNDDVTNLERKDSTDIYGAGNYDYKDSLESFHKGYSTPRDSIYKYWNTQMIKVPYTKDGKQYWATGNELDVGNHFQNIKMLREAIFHYNKYIGNVSTNHSAYMNRGTAYERLELYDSAMMDYIKVLQLKPDDTIAHFNKGNIHDIRDHYDLAVIQYDSVIIKDPRLAKAYYNRGSTNANVKNYEAAVRDYEEALRLNPTYGPELRPRIKKLKPLIKK